MTQIPQLPPHIDVQDDDLLVVRQSDNKDHKVPVAALSKGNVRYVQTIDDLRAVNGMQDGQAVEIVSTGRAGLFTWESGDLSAECAADPMMGIYVAPTGQDGSAGAWGRSLDDTVEVAWFHSGSNDHAPAINASGAVAISLGKTLVSGSDLRIETGANLRMVQFDFRNAKITVAGGAVLTIGGRAVNPSCPDQFLFRIEREGGATTTPTVMVVGARSQRIEIQWVDYLQLYADTQTLPWAGSVAYNSFDIGYVGKLEFWTNPSAPNQQQWINENQFRIGSVRTVLIDGTYKHNHNRFYGCTLEAGASVTIENGTDNHFYDVRGEGSYSVNFGAGSERNTVSVTWTSSESATYGLGGAVVNDNGSYNRVFKQYRQMSRKEVVARIGLLSDLPPTVQMQTTQHGGGYDVLVVTEGFGEVVRSDVFPVSLGDQIYLGMFPSENSAASGFRFAVTLYDVNMNPVADAAGQFYSGTMTVVSGGTVSTGTDRSFAWLVPKSSNIRYASARITAGNNPSGPNSEFIGAEVYRLGLE